MREWNLVRLCDLATHIKDGTHGTHVRVESGIPLLSAKNINNGQLVWDKSDDQISYQDYLAITSTFAPKQGDLLLTIVGSVGRSAIFDGSEVAFQRSVAFVRPNQTVIPEYLFQASCHENFLRQLDRRSNVTAQAGLYLGELAKVSVLLPSKKLQKKIARILQTTDQAIEKTEALIEKYQCIKAGLMHDLFTCGIGTDGKLRPPREQTPELYRQTRIGWIPKEWELLCLDEVAEIIDPQPDHRTPPEHLEGVPYIGIGDFDKFGELDLQKCRKVIKEAFEKQRLRFVTKSGDIIFGKIGTIGKPKTLKNGDYALSANVVLIKPNIAPNYVRHCLDSTLFLKQISDITNTTSQPALGIEKIRVIRFPVPTNPVEIDYIYQKLDALDNKIRCEGHSLEKLVQQKSGLMHDLLTGKVQVNIEQTEPAHVVLVPNVNVGNPSRQAQAWRDGKLELP